MGTEGDSRSLGTGLSIPQWMKTKISEKRFEIDNNAFSPPENDDSFFYIRYPQVSTKLKSPNPSRKNSTTLIETVTKPDQSPKLEANYLNHTDPCKQSIIHPGYQPYSSIRNKSPDLKLKSHGTDDGFQGEGAACGSSVIRVAHQMVSGKYINNYHPALDADPLKPKDFDATKRRGSKSLPVTPISSPSGSPMSRRRLINKYFTGPFVDNENHGNYWFLQGLLSKRDISQSVGVITEEGKSGGDLTKAISELRVDNVKPEVKIEKRVKKEYSTKASEFRELNFWSPTSM